MAKKRRRRRRATGTSEVQDERTSFGTSEIIAEKFANEPVPLDYEGDALVDFKASWTLRTSDFEYRRISVGITIPCDLSEVDDALASAVEWAEKRAPHIVQQMFDEELDK